MNHKDDEEHEALPRKHDNSKTDEKIEHRLRVSSRLTDELEAQIHAVIGCCINVHRGLGPGLLESIYCRAIILELLVAGINFEAQKRVAVTYRGEVLCYQRLDLVVEESIVLEIKSVERLMPVHHAQVLSYLRVSALPVGLLINFNVAVLPDGLKRIVL